MLKRFALILALCLPCAAQAAFPDKPFRIIVANQAGGPVDVMLRVLANKLGETWNQPVVVENRPGASGIISTGALVKSPADGYSLGMVVASALTIVPFAVDHLPYDSQKDLQPVSLVARTPFLFIVRNDSPLKTWDDFVRASKARELAIGSFAHGTAFHLIWEQTARRAGIKALYVPSTSSTKTQADLIGGQLDIALDAPSSSQSLIQAGRIRPLVITSPARFAGMPDTPTLNESGMAGYAPQPWIGLMAPAGVPADRIDFIQKSVAKVLQDPAMKAQMATLGMIPIGSSPGELGATIERDRSEMAPIIKELGIRLE
jgi:tripartite-type tricarboxylate transporter receptor subunit TctC